MELADPASGFLDLTEGYTEDFTDIEEQKQNNKSTLMSLLSGKQNTKKKLRGKTKRKENVEKFLDDNGSVERNRFQIIGHESTERNTLDPDMQDPNSTTLTEELTEITDTSFDALEFERKLDSQRTLAELEQKVFKQSRSVSAMELLRGKKRVECLELDPELVEEVTSEEPVIVEDVIMEDTTEHILVEDDPIKLLEQRFSHKRTAARDLFSAFTPKPVKNSKGDWTLKVKLRIDPVKLATIKEFENPLMAKGIRHLSGKSFMSTLMRTKPSCMVTFQIRKDFLRQIEKTSNPLYTKSSGNQNGKPAKSVFAMMMQSANQSAYPKLTPIQKLKELQPPSITKSSMHVYPHELFRYSLEKLQELPLRAVLTHHTDITGESMDSLQVSNDSLTSVEVKCILSDKSDAEIITKRSPLALSNPAHRRIYEEYIQKGTSSDSLNWPQRFQPPDLKTLLLSDYARIFIRDWIENAFLVLSTQSTKTPRNVKLREQAKKQKKREAELGFIVDDDYDEGEETDEDIFVPVLIISGETGSGKTSSVYAALNALNGYVHEINAGQQRSRKDLYGSLKEFCTTQIIHQNLVMEGKTFQKGVVLFEDCDILFEQDKTFWTVVQDVVNFSKRPIVITVTSTTVIPRNIWDLAKEQNSFIHLLNPNRDSIQQYVWLCAYSCGYDLSPELQEKILSECKVQESYDLRKALMNAQWLCCRTHVPQGKIMELVYEPPLSPKLGVTNDLTVFAEQAESLSVSDVIGEGSTSKFLHDSHVNEFLDIYVVHDSMLAKQPLQHELNIGKELQEMMRGSIDSEFTCKFTYNQFRDIVLDFLRSRRKKLPRFVQSLQNLRSYTRSRSSSDFIEEEPELQLLPDTSTCYSMSPNSFILDLAPFARLWSNFQKVIFSMDMKSMENGQDTNLETFLEWRRFYHNVDEILETSPLKIT